MIRSTLVARGCYLLMAAWIGSVIKAAPGPAQTLPDPGKPPAPPVLTPPPAPEAPQPSEATHKPSLPDVWAEPNPCLPGQTVSFYTSADVWKVVTKGERGGRWQPKTGAPFLTDTPQKPATYHFDLWLRRTPPGGDKPALVRRRRDVTVDIYGGRFPALSSYHDRRGWRVDMLKGWRTFDSPQDDPARNALVFFETQEDAGERLAVAMLPVGTQTAAELMEKAMDDAPTQYDVLKDIVQKDTFQCGEPAVWTTFSGIDRSLPGVGLRGIVMTLVRNGIGYVVSARTTASAFDLTHQRMLRCLVRSFAFEPAKPPPPARSPRQ